MKTNYHITSSGAKYVIASVNKTPAAIDSNQSLLLYFLKQKINGAIAFSDILNHFNNDKPLAFKKITQLISLQLIDINEPETENLEPINTSNEYFLDSIKTDDNYLFVDLNGFPISYCGFNQQQAISISSVAYDYIKASSRSRNETENNSLQTPRSIKTSWSDFDIIICLLYLENFSCLLITKNTHFMDSNEFINLASYLCNRYNYE
ncbi:hypothetical protein MNBD_GAMMA08-1505 [hydrothermal vent metagenome]|uniref:Uncharacterized protein n=1 Tax=hydrothermal vent metagenome TaxID=652676 RepID=A0A3B0WRX1_9ZZZZ